MVPCSLHRATGHHPLPTSVVRGSARTAPLASVRRPGRPTPAARSCGQRPESLPSSPLRTAWAGVDPLSLPAAQPTAAPHGIHSRGRQYLCRAREEKKRSSRDHAACTCNSSLASSVTAMPRYVWAFLSYLLHLV